SESPSRDLDGTPDNGDRRARNSFCSGVADPSLQGPDPGGRKAFLCSPALVAVVNTGPPLDIHLSGGDSLARSLAPGPPARAGRRGPSRRRSYVVCTAESLRVDV